MNKLLTMEIKGVDYAAIPICIETEKIDIMKYIHQK